tara:strand:- start:1519 stop:3897 length:2379 start_codon:yes stop_codon:yes gene_type:complete
MSIRVSDPLFLLSAQTGLSVGELKAKAAAGNPDLEKKQEALKTGEPIPILFGRFRNGSGGVMVQPKATEAYFSNSITEKVFSTNGGTTTFIQPIERLELKYLLVLSEGNMSQMQVRDLFYGTCRRGTFNQVYNGRAGTWSPGNNIDNYHTYTATPNAQGYYVFDVSTLSAGESIRYPKFTYYKDSNNLVSTINHKEYGFPVFCGTSGSYSGLTTLSFEYDLDDADAEDIGKTINVFVRNGLEVTRLVDGATAESDNYVDLVKYLFQANNRLADDLIDTTALTTAAKFTDTNSFLFNGAITESQNLLDWVQETSANFLLRITNVSGKFGLQPRLPYNTDHTIKTTQVTPEFAFTEEHVVDGGFEIEYISLEDRQPVCFVIQWRQQPEANFGLVRTVEVRYAGEAASGPFVNIDMSDYCTNENHAVKVGAFRLAQRKFVTHHLRLTVREQNYNSTLVVGDLVRVRLRRETDAGEVAYHDKLYEINRIEKTFSSTIVYDLTHFPIDTQGRSIIAREVADAVGAGNTIDVGRSTFDCDENSSTDNTPIGTGSGGGGSNQPPLNDTQVPIPQPDDVDSPYPDGPNSPTDPLNETLDGSVSGNPQITGYEESAPLAGDTLSYSPGCAGAFTEWFAVDQVTNERTLLGSGVSATLAVTQAMEDDGITVVGVGRCPDPSTPDGYGEPIESNSVKIGITCLSGTNGCQEVDGYGTAQIFDGINSWFNPWQAPLTTLPDYAKSIKATRIIENKSEAIPGGTYRKTVTWDTLLGSISYTTTSTSPAPFTVRIFVTNGTCIKQC